jgi:hypothetical protein
MKWSFKQWWFSNSPQSAKRTIISNLNWAHWTQQYLTTYDVGNPSPGLGHSQNCGCVKPANMICGQQEIQKFKSEVFRIVYMNIVNIVSVLFICKHVRNITKTLLTWCLIF